MSEKYVIFNFTSIISGILLIFSLFFIPQPSNIMYIPFLFLIVGFLASILIKSNKSIEFLKFLYVFALGIILRLVSTALPTSSDIFWVSKGSIDYILKGLNPYGVAFPVYNNPQIHTVISAYLPFSILFEIPFQVLLGDLRYAIIFADVGIAVLLYLIIKVKNEDIARAAAGFYMLLTFPLNFGTPQIISEYRIFNGVIDPIWVFLILAAVYAYMKDKRFAAAILIGLSVATKQVAVLILIPMFMMWIRKKELGKRQYNLIVISLLTSIGVLLPFVFASNGFIAQTLFLMGQQCIFKCPALFPQLSFLGIEVPLIGARLIQVSLVLLILFYFRNKITNIHLSLRVGTFIYIIFLAFNNFVLFYYWFSVIPFLIIIFVYHYKEQENIVTSTDKK